MKILSHWQSSTIDITSSTASLLVEPDASQGTASVAKLK
jgi:hypothetical protein